jgi:hypothetical protein
VHLMSASSNVSAHQAYLKNQSVLMNIQSSYIIVREMVEFKLKTKVHFYIEMVTRTNGNDG